MTEPPAPLLIDRDLLGRVVAHLRAPCPAPSWDPFEVENYSAERAALIRELLDLKGAA